MSFWLNINSFQDLNIFIVGHFSTYATKTTICKEKFHFCPMQSFLGESYYVFRGIVLGEEGNMTPLKTTVWEASLNPA